jgi:hypothetical protein
MIYVPGLGPVLAIRLFVAAPVKLGFARLAAVNSHLGCIIDGLANEFGGRHPSEVEQNHRQWSVIPHRKGTPKQLITYRTEALEARENWHKLGDFSFASTLQVAPFSSHSKPNASHASVGRGS